MKRSRLAIVVVTHLAIGAVMTVLTAWFLMIREPLPLSSNVKFVGGEGLPSRWTPDDIPLITVFHGRSLVHSHWQLLGPEEGPDMGSSEYPYLLELFVASFYRVGFPLPAMETGGIQNNVSGEYLQRPLDHGLGIPDWAYIFRRKIMNRTFYNVLPIRPVPLGFAVNSLFYGGLSFSGTRVFAAWRRRRRIRHGRCGECGYAIEGLDRCPECGRAVGLRGS